MSGDVVCRYQTVVPSDNYCSFNLVKYRECFLLPADFRHTVYSASFNFVRVLATSVRQADLHHIPRHGQYDYSLLVVVDCTYIEVKKFEGQTGQLD